MKLELLNNSDVVVRSAVGTIKNDDNNSALSVADAEGDEPTAGTGKITFKLSLSQVSGRQVRVRWATADGTAAAGVDYVAASGTATIAPGASSVDVDVAVIGDLIDEENETVKLVLSNPEGIPASKLVDAEAIGTIVDRNASPSLSISDAFAREGEGASLVVTLSGTTTRTVTVRFSTREGFARSNDFLARVGTLTFEPGEKTKPIDVTIVEDSEFEPSEDFTVLLEDPVNALITKASGRITIEASDQQGGTTPPPTTPPSTNPTPTPTPTPGPNTTPPPTGTPQGTNTPKAVQAPRMILGPRAMKVDANGIARVTVTCQRASPIVCAGTVELERAAKPLLKLGKRTFKVAKGKKGVAPVKLSARALATLMKNRTMRVKVVVTYKKSVGTGKATPGVVTLTAPKKLAKPKPKPKAEPATKVEVVP
jgi:hypothetical protein